MKRIRLQIQVLPWDTASVANQQARQDEVRPWTQPEDAENTLQRLVENITQRYGRIYVGRGALKVKELQDSWGSTLDLTDTVGDVFDDRSSSGDILTSICKVIRYPPDPAELHNPTRFASLLPESSARPQKRPPPPLFRNAPRLLPSIEETTEQGRQSAFAQPNKRRKTTREASTRDGNSRAVPLSREQLQESQDQRSERQVLDSQISPTRSKNMMSSVMQSLNMALDGNSYGTPNSLTDRNRAPSAQNTIHVVPDSPSNGRASANRRDRDRTKSESPELRVSVHDVAPSQEEINAAQTSSRLASNPPSHDGINDAAQPLVVSIEPVAPAQPVVPSQPKENVQAHEDLSVPDPRPEVSARKTSPLPSNSSGPKASLEKSPTMLSDPLAFEASARNPPDAPHSRADTGLIADSEATNTRRTKADVFDPIESDSEGFHTRQQMFAAKRLTLSKTPDKNGAITGKSLSTSASKSQLKGPKSNGFLLTTSNLATGTGKQAAVLQRPRTAVNEQEQANSTLTSPPKSINDRKRVLEALPPNLQARSTPMPVETEISADVLSQLATSEVSSSEKEDQRAGQSEPPQSSSFKSQDGSNDDNAHSVDATDHAGEGDGVSQLSPADGGVGSSRSKGLNILRNTNAEAECRNPDQASDGPMKPLMGPPAIPNAYVEVWKKSSTAEGNSQPEEMGTQRLSQELQRTTTMSKDTTAQTPDATSANSLRKVALQEKQLAEQAERMMVAADGARQLKLEQAKLNQGARTPKANGWTAVNGNTVQQRSMAKRQEVNQKRREAQSAAARKFREKNQYATSNPYEVGKAALTNSQGIPSSQLSSSQKIESEGVSSSVSNVDSMSSSKRRTLTPSHPPPTSSDVQQYSSPVSSRSVASNGLPLKSALRQPTSNLRRSVSQVAFNEDPSKPAVERTVLNGASSSPSFLPPTSNPPKSTLTKAKPAKITSQPVIKARSKGTKKSTTKPATRQVQSTLQVTRDKKQKGRLAGPLITKTISQQDKKSISSSSDEDSISSFISDEVADVGISKAGPSSKQKPTSTRGLQPEKNSLTQMKTSSVKSSSPLPEAFSSSIDPALQALKPSASQSSGNASSHNSQSNHDSHEHAEEPTSGQIETADRSSGSETDSDDEPIPTGTKPLRKIALGKSTSHHEMPDSRSSKTSSKSTQVRADKMLANGMRPANYKYPSLSQLKRDAQGKPHRPRVVQPKASDPMPENDPAESESESDEDDSESESDSGSNHAATHKKKSGFLAGARGLFKIISSK